MARSSENARTPQGVTPSGIDVLDRAASILFAFRLDDEPLTLTQLSERTGLYKSTLSRLAQALCHHSFLTRLEDGRYWIGSSALHLSAVYQAGFDLRDILLPAMKELSAVSGEAVSFHVRERDHRVCLYRIASRHSIRAEVQQGDVQPLDRGAGGRVLLAFSGKRGEPYDGIRARCVYLSIGERDPETAGISAPVFRVGQELVGALGIVGPAARMGIEEMERYRPSLLQFAARVTAALGGDAAPLLAAAAMSAEPRAGTAGRTTRVRHQSKDKRSLPSGKAGEKKHV
ncbi:IclR family transcriptional regulator [Paraburkholderia sp. FT54]|jgi:DNA-binding IclR family transcriptional regulator|uniref:IclR family transcriptional regulator n=1 Tax=Paraburkholderia sp. FT54 TaxID=3074437 RepID=UPI002877D190|nr:IclR family transcriptional regulator [Paraburkholderia sp. FT54]WNC94778.1 IclR family transcriptional regulator [Paraburkholderia sp. FT54]